MKIKDRIKEFKRVPANQIRPNPRNWRTHPDKQKDALRGILAEVGIADAVIVRQINEKEYEIIDGHLRTEVIGNQKIPVLILDVTEEEAAKLLATIDPLSDLAEKDSQKLNELLEGVTFDSDAINRMMEEINDFHPGTDDEPGEDSEDSEENPEIKESFNILIECENEQQQTELLERFEKEGLSCKSLIS